MDFIVTGATGFVGSHLVLRWLRHDPAARVGCLVRAADGEAGTLRLRAALARAAAEAGETDDMTPRVDAFLGDLEEPAWIDQAAAWMRGPAELVHCAANLSFRAADDAAVWHSNVDGTASLLHALPRLPGLAGFNYVSTAYVAGDRQGEIREGDHVRPNAFNNPYEHSKWAAEAVVRTECAGSGIPWRILRPSIVIGHSRTHRLSSHSGFYQVIDTLMGFGRHPRLAGQTILLPVTVGTNLDLIPVDQVADEIVGLVAGGSATANRTFHVVAADPLPLAVVLRELTPMTGVSIEVNGPDTPLSPVARLAMQRLRYYMPYFGFARRFDRSAAAAALPTAPARMGVEQLRAFVLSYLHQSGGGTDLADAA